MSDPHHSPPERLDSPENLPSQQQVNILLVDDQPANLLALQAILQDLGYNLVEARSGEEALQRLAGGEFALVLLDVRMPGLDGFEATQSIKEAHPWIQVVFLTFYDELLPKRSPQETGAFAFLLKGCSPGLMRDVIFRAAREAWSKRWGGEPEVPATQAPASRAASAG